MEMTATISTKIDLNHPWGVYFNKFYQMMLPIIILFKRQFAACEYEQILERRVLVQNKIFQTYPFISSLPCDNQNI